jgi:hypothetical protein
MPFRLRSGFICVALIAGLCLANLIVSAAADDDFYKILGVAKDANERQLKKVCILSIYSHHRGEKVVFFHFGRVQGKTSLARPRKRGLMGGFFPGVPQVEPAMASR